ncbi:MAG: trypsin-like serine protease [Gemmataceae bacterium]|nr:trypsin-like serine protease [Gemmataceae bacterium]
MFALLTRWLTRPSCALNSSRRPSRAAAKRPTLILEELEPRLALTISAVGDASTFPFSAVAQMEVVNDGHTITCSGVLLDGTHVLTAAHCLYDFARGRGPAESVTAYPGRSGDTELPFGQVRGTSWVVHGSYLSGQFAGMTAFDLGVVTLDRALSAAGSFQLLPLYPESYFDFGGTINILGYPGDSFSGVEQYFSTGPAQGADANEIRWALRDLPVEHGSSGSPVYVRDGNNRAVVGVVSELSASGGFGTRITSGKYNWIISQLTPASSGANGGATPTSGALPPGPAQTPGVFDPTTATWYLRNANSPGAPDIEPFAYGSSGWVPVVGDWDGDDTDSIGVVDPATLTWYLKNSNSPGAPDITPFAYGSAGWIPVVGDWDGDGTDTVGVFDPTTATWYLKNSNTLGAPDITPFAYGSPGWLPVVGDWDGDGVTTIGVVEPATMTWYLKNSNTLGAPDISPFAYGAPGWLPVVGDWDGEGRTGVGVVEPETMLWYLRNGAAGGAPDFTPFAYGSTGWLPLAGDWDGPGNPRSPLRVSLAADLDTPTDRETTNQGEEGWLAALSLSAWAPWDEWEPFDR